MVGVAGKSKGCTTCRRRKVRCGQERPCCANCVQSGRSCEGYERFPVFINRTARGLQRRNPLEEAKPFSSGLSTVTETSICSVQPLSPSVGQVWSASFLGWFWDNYSPNDGPSKTVLSGPMWLFHAMKITQPTEALSQSLLALSIVRRGRANRDITLLNEGRRIYGQALRILQKDLYSQQHALHEETLAATRAMALYELYEATSNTAGSWQYHVSGLASLIKFRGPRNYSTPLARAIFEEFRYPLLIQCITTRKVYALADPVWLTAPWADSIKDKEQLLYDHGFSLACLLEKLDKLEKMALEDRSASNFDILIHVMTSSLELSNSLEDFKSAYLTRSITLNDPFLNPPFQSSDVKTQHCKMDDELEILVMTWWAFVVVLAFAGKRAAVIATQSASRLPDTIRDALLRCSEKLAFFENDTSSDYIGRRVLAYINTCLQRHMSHFWLSRTIFPLAAAALQFHHSKTERDMCERLKEYITERQGFRFAQRVKSEPGLQIFLEDGPESESVR